MSEKHQKTQETEPGSDAASADHTAAADAEGDKLPREVGGRAGPDPTRFGDWEKNGRCIDF